MPKPMKALSRAAKSIAMRSSGPKRAARRGTQYHDLPTCRSRARGVALLGAPDPQADHTVTLDPRLGSDFLVLPPVEICDIADSDPIATSD